MLGPGINLIGVVENSPFQRAIFLPPTTVQPITITRWQDTTLRFTIYEAGGPLVDLTAWTLTWTVRRNSADAGFLLRKTGTLQPLRGKGCADVVVASADWRSYPPGRYVFDAFLSGSSLIQVVPVSPLTLLPGMTKNQ